MGVTAKRIGRWLAVTGLLATCFLSPQAPVTTTGARAAATPDSLAPLPDGEDSNQARADFLDHLGVALWHRQGVRGRGVKVAILDSGFRGYHAYLDHILPASVQARSFRSDGNLEARDSQHGILCAEVVHALAPDAEILLANWEPDRPDQFLDAVRWARQEGARILTCSVIMPAWSDGEGHGNIHRELARLLGSGEGAGDMLCFASAGNTAQRHWSGTFHDGGAGWHAWGEDVVDNYVKPWGNERVSVELCAAPRSTLQVVVEDVTSHREVGHAAVTGSSATATVRFSPLSGHDYNLRVRRLDGDAGFFHLVVLGGGLQYATPHGSIPFPGDGPEVVAVGAVDPDGHRLAYSSCGPNSDRPKPDFVASVPFPSLWRSRPFSGTSAAAPQAAALAALVFARHPAWTAQQVRKALEGAAEDLGPPGHDWETGFGRVHLP
jgi:subtilisin family serine protease